MELKENTAGLNEEVAKEIIQMAEVDQEIRRQAMEEGRVWDESSDTSNTERMREIVSQIGWPSQSLVGPDASSKAWLLVQHADHDVMFQSDCLRMMKAADQGEVRKQEIAYLEDRVRVNRGKPQLYGTQFLKNINGEYLPKPIESPDEVDKRREEMGLGPLEEYKIGFKNIKIPKKASSA